MNRKTMVSFSRRKKRSRAWLCKEENPLQLKHKHRETTTRRKTEQPLTGTTKEEEEEEEEDMAEVEKEKEEEGEGSHRDTIESGRQSRLRKTSGKRN